MQRLWILSLIISNLILMFDFKCNIYGKDLSGGRNVCLVIEFCSGIGSLLGLLCVNVTHLPFASVWLQPWLRFSSIAVKLSTFSAVSRERRGHVTTKMRVLLQSEVCLEFVDNSICRQMSSPGSDSAVLHLLRFRSLHAAGLRVTAISTQSPMTSCHRSTKKPKVLLIQRERSCS